VLEHHSDVAARLAQLRVVQLGQVAAIDDDFAPRGPVEQVDNAHQRAFARAAAPDDAEHLAWGDLQVNAPQGLHRAL